MSLVWFGEVWKRSGGTLSAKRASRVHGVWLLRWCLQLISWTLVPLLWSSTPPSTAASRKRRGSSVTSWRRNWRKQMGGAELKPQWLSSNGVTVTVTPRWMQPHLVTIHDGVRTCSVYGLAAARVELEARGVEADDLLMEWLWGLQGVWRDDARHGGC